MTRADVNEVVVGELGSPYGPLTLHAGTRLVEDMHADSLDLVQVAMALEDEFGVEIADEQADKWRTLGDIYSTVGAAE